LIASGEFKAQSLSFWLKRIATLHPRKIELGLDRVKAVANRMGLTKPARQVITVAGTNGKGSCVACLQAILEQAGYRTGAYTWQYLNKPVTEQEHTPLRISIISTREFA